MDSGDVFSRSSLKVAAGVDRLRAARLLSRLCESSGRAVDLRINNNRSTLLSVTRPRNGAIRFSVHRMFLDAPAEVVAALAAYMVGARGRGCEGLLRTYMDEQSARMDAASPDQDGDADASHRRAVLKNLRARGAVYDLHRLAEEVNRDYFGGDVRVNITWSRGAREPRSRNGFRRHIIFGSYDRPHALVRIHPALDSADVPEFFVKFVIYHEMLHHVLDVKPQPGGRRCVHTPQFRDRERRHPDFKRAMEWERLFMRGEHKS